MKYEKSVLKNGIRVITVPMPSLESATIDIWVNVGSRHEPKELSGISHFLEHTVLDGGKKYPTSSAVWTTIDSVGGEMNAATSKDFTNYYTKVHTDHLQLGFDILADVLINTRFNPKDIKKERTVILDEISRGNDVPRAVVWKNFSKLIFNGDALAREVIGTKKIVAEMSRADVVKYKEKYYIGENIVISSAGGVTHKDVVELAEEYFGGVKSDITRRNSEHGATVSMPKKRLIMQEKDTEQTNLVMGFPGITLDDDRRYAESVLRVILGSGASSRLFMKIREEHALAYSVGSTSSHFLGAGYYAAYAGTAPKNARKALDLMIEEHQKLLTRSKARVTEKEFKKAINFIKGHTALALEDSKAVSEDVAYDEMLLGKIEMPHEYLEKVEKVTMDEVFELAKDLFNLDKMVLSVIGPHKNESEFEKVLGQ